MGSLFLMLMAQTFAANGNILHKHGNMRYLQNMLISCAIWMQCQCGNRLCQLWWMSVYSGPPNVAPSRCKCGYPGMQYPALPSVCSQAFFGLGI